MAGSAKLCRGARDAPRSCQRFSRRRAAIPCRFGRASDGRSGRRWRERRHADADHENRDVIAGIIRPHRAALCWRRRGFGEGGWQFEFVSGAFGARVGKGLPTYGKGRHAVPAARVGKALATGARAVPRSYRRFSRRSAAIPCRFGRAGDGRCGRRWRERRHADADHENRDVIAGIIRPRRAALCWHRRGFGEGGWQFEFVSGAFGAWVGKGLPTYGKGRHAVPTVRVGKALATGPCHAAVLPALFAP
jgi:hypothetical protein